MLTWRYQPVNVEVARFVDCYWWLEAHKTYSCHPHLLLNPMANANLIITKRGQVDSYQFNYGKAQASGSYLLLPTNQSVILDEQPPIRRLGIRFKVGAPYALFKVEGVLQLNQITSDLQNLNPGLGVGALESLANKNGATHQALVEQLDQLMLPLLDYQREDKCISRVRQIISVLQESPLVAIERELCCSRRTLERSFLKVTGLRLKQYEMITRLDKLFLYIYQTAPDKLDWPAIAMAFGFSDQSHLIRQLKRCIGVAPSRYLALRNLVIDAYGDFGQPLLHPEPE